MFEPQPFASKSSVQDELVLALQRRDLAAFEQLLRDPEVDPNFWYGKPYWSTCMQLALKMEGGEPFVVALVRAGAAGHADKASQKDTKQMQTPPWRPFVKQVVSTRKGSPNALHSSSKTEPAVKRRITMETVRSKRVPSSVMEDKLDCLAKELRDSTEALRKELQSLTKRVQMLEAQQKRTNELLGKPTASAAGSRPASAVGSRPATPASPQSTATSLSPSPKAKTPARRSQQK